MNDNMLRLMELVKETDKLITNIQAETKAVKGDITEKYKEIYDEMMGTVKECLEVSRQIKDYSPLVKLKSHRRLYDGTPAKETYYFRLDDHRSMVVYGSKDYCVGLIEYDHSYEITKSESRRDFDLDEILKEWNSDDFRIEFTKEVERIITLKAQKANEEYEKARRNLNEMQ